MNPDLPLNQSIMVNPNFKTRQERMQHMELINKMASIVNGNLLA